MRISIFSIFLLFTLLAAGGRANALTPLSLQPAIEKYEVLPHAEMLAVDAAGRQHFVPFKDEGAFHFHKDLQWLRFSIDNPTNAPVEWLLTNEFHMHIMTVISTPGVGAPEYAGCQYNALQYHPSLFPTLKLRLPPGVSTHLVGFNPDGHPGFPILYLRAPTEYLAHFENELAFFGAIFVPFLILAIFSLTVLSPKAHLERLRYISLYLGLWGVPVSYSGIPFLFGPNIGKFVTANWMVWFSILMLCSGLFSYKSMKVFKNRFPRMLALATTLHLLAAPVYYRFFPVPACCINLLFITVMNPFVVYRSRMVQQNWDMMDPYHLYSFLPVMTVGTLLVMAIAGLSPYHPFMLYALDLSALTHLLVLLFGLARKSVADRIEFSRLEQSLELGHSVQNLLLPTAMAGEKETFKYNFYFLPYRDQMSGDWINQWTNEKGEQIFIIGDVVGKGPQAGLSVASISTIIDRFKRTAPERVTSCLAEINTTLYRLFMGESNTTISAIRVGCDNQVTLYNAGGFGWYHYRATDAKVVRHALRGSLIGMDPSCEVADITLEIAPGDMLYTFTDGVCASSSACRRMAKQIAMLGPGGHYESFMEQFFATMDPRALEDDRTMIIISFKDPQLSSRENTPFQAA